MAHLLSLVLIVEPDRQRLAGFALHAVEALGGNTFAAAIALDAVLGELRTTATREQRPTEVAIALEDRELGLVWDDRRAPLTTLPRPPAADQVRSLVQRLREASEAADSALLVQRNRQIHADLEVARNRARTEMAELETALEKKKSELKETLRLAETDSLTGLYNRGAYDTRLAEAFRRSLRQREALTLIMLDLDKFKEINDTHGHQYGDEVLKNMAATMRAAIREHVDLPFRIGGDEFAIVVFADTGIAQRIAGRVLQTMNNGVSIGIAQAETDDTVESLVARADAALYEAKRSGRNQVAIFNGQTVPGWNQGEKTLG